MTITSTQINNNIGGGFQLEDADSLTMSSSTVMNNMNSYYAGGIYAYSSMVMLTNVNITGNSGSYAGGVYVGNDVGYIFTMTNCVLQNNNATAVNYYPMNNELNCDFYGVIGTICSCPMAGLDFNQNCTNCFNNLYGSTCNMMCSCPEGKTCSSGLLGTGLCSTSSSKHSSEHSSMKHSSKHSSEHSSKHNSEHSSKHSSKHSSMNHNSIKNDGIHYTISATLLFCSVIISIVLKLI